VTTYAFIYARASADKALQKISTDRQVKLCTERAHERWPDAEVRVFRDDSLTAADPEVYRPGFAEFLAAVRAARKGELVGVVTNEQSRLTRQGTGAWDDLVVTLTKAGVAEVETMRGAVSVKPGNRLVGRLLAVVDAEEVERIKARCGAAHADLFTEGRPAGRPPFGFVRVEDEKGRAAWIEDPVEGPIVRQVYDMAAAGHASAAIVDMLNAGPCLPRSAGWNFKDRPRKITGWLPNTVRLMLRNPAYAGLRAHTDADGVRHTVPATWDALVDVDQWQAVQRLMGQPSVVTGRNGELYKVRNKPAAQPRKYLLSGGRRRSGVPGEPGEVYGVLRCWKCGMPLVAGTQRASAGRRVPGYTCHPNIGSDACGGVTISPADELEAHVVAAIQHQLKRNRKVAKLLDATERSEAGRWRNERDEAKARMLEAGQLLGAGTVDRDTFDQIHGAAKAIHDAAEGRLASMTTGAALPTADDVINRWDTLTLTAQRAVVERLIESIEIGPATKYGVAGFDPDRLGTPKWRA